MLANTPFYRSPISVWEGSDMANTMTVATPASAAKITEGRIGDSDEGDRWFRTDGDQRSGIDVISRRSEATLANGFCRK